MNTIEKMLYNGRVQKELSHRTGRGRDLNQLTILWIRDIRRKNHYIAEDTPNYYVVVGGRYHEVTNRIARRILASNSNIQMFHISTRIRVN